MKYGNVFTTSDYTDALLKSNRTQSGLKTWSQMYGSIDLAAQQADAALRSNYANEVSEAYANSHAQKSVIYGSNLSEGYKAAAASDVDAALNEAYESYRSNYLSDLQEIDSSKIAAQSQISTMLTEQAEMTKLYEQSHIDYVKYLYENLGVDESIPSDLFGRAGWSNFISSDGELLSDDEIHKMMYDENGNLTLKGVDIYNMVENDLSDSGYKSFGSYLAEQDAVNKTNLLDWAMTYNPYSYTALTNAGSFKELVGIRPNEYTYNPDLHYYEKFLNDQFDIDGFVQGLNASNERAISAQGLQEGKSAKIVAKSTEYMYNSMSSFLNEYDIAHGYFLNPEHRSITSNSGYDSVYDNEKIVNTLSDFYYSYDDAAREGDTDEMNRITKEYTDYVTKYIKDNRTEAQRRYGSK